MQITDSTLKSVSQAVRMTSSDEIACDECFDSMDRFAEANLTGLDAATALPLVARHLAMCPDCGEEFEALLTALTAMVRPRPRFRFWRR